MGLVLQCHLLKLEMQILTWDADVSVENCPRASALNELMLFSELKIDRLLFRGSALHYAATQS